MRYIITFLTIFFGFVMDGDAQENLMNGGAQEREADTTIYLVPRREYMSIKTNLLFDGAYMPGYDRFCPIPNVAVEFYPLHGHFTYGASFDGPWWQHYDDHKYFKHRKYVFFISD